MILTSGHPQALQSAALTDVGLRRERNEDSLIALPEHGIFAVADGMGGATGGREASQAIIECIRDAAAVERIKDASEQEVQRIVQEAISTANRAILHYAEEHGAYGMGSTVVALHLNRVRNTASVTHAGDSRAYLYRGGKIKRLTADHTIAAEIGIDDEAEIVPTCIDGMLTRAIGLQDPVELEFSDLKTRPGDVFLLCSDGLTRHLTDRDIASYLSKYPSMSLEKITEELVSETKRRGAFDNVTVVAVAVDEQQQKQRRGGFLSFFMSF